MKRIFFDARMIDHPGIGRYIRSLLPELIKGADLDIVLLGNENTIRNFLGKGPGVIDFPYPIYSMREQLEYAILKKTVKNNILHIPHYNIPVGGGYKLVATLHDIIHILYPGGAKSRLAPFYMKHMVKRMLMSAERIICVSRFTRSSLKGIGPVKDERLTVIEEGVNDTFFKMNDKDYLASVKNKYNLPHNFILYVGSIRRHKNIQALLDSFTLVRRRIPDIALVLIGRYSQPIDLKREGVAYLGEVADDKELAAIYNLSSVFCNLSLYEGFGLTVLEAQKCGIPVVCSAIPAHIEVGGKGIISVPAGDIDRIAETLYNVLTDDALRRELITRGLENTGRFSWALAAEKTKEVYRSI